MGLNIRQDRDDKGPGTTGLVVVPRGEEKGETTS